jgi:hypothetical protein
VVSGGREWQGWGSVRGGGGLCVGKRECVALCVLRGGRWGGRISRTVALCRGSLLQADPPFPPQSVPLIALVPLPALKTECGQGNGLAVWPGPPPDLLVTSDRDKNTLSVWGVPDGASGGGGALGGAGASAGAGAGGASAGGGGGGLTLVCTLGGKRSVAPMRFKFKDDFSSSGYLAFTPPATTSGSDSDSARPLLLVTDAGHDAVHLVDVVGRSHAGYLASPGSIAGPRGVAATSSSDGAVLVAVSAWKEGHRGDHVVVVYKGSGAVWEAVRVIGDGFSRPGRRDGQLSKPYGLRFSGDGSAICVADWGNDRASVFSVGDGVFARHMATGLSGPHDVEEVVGGWLVACWGSHCVEFVGDGNGDDGGRRPSLGKAGGEDGDGDGEFAYPTALVVVPDLWLVVREAGNPRLQVFGRSTKRDKPGLEGREATVASPPPAPVEEVGGGGGGGGGDDDPVAVAAPALAPDLDRAAREVRSGSCLGGCFISE